MQGKKGKAKEKTRIQSTSERATNSMHWVRYHSKHFALAREKRKLYNDANIYFSRRKRKALRVLLSAILISVFTQVDKITSDFMYKIIKRIIRFKSMMKAC